MEAPIVRTDYEQMKEIAARFAQAAEENRRMLQGLRHDKEVLQGGDWIGVGARAFYAEMDGQVLPSLTRLVAGLDRAAAAARQISGIVQQAEADAAAVLNRYGHESGRVIHPGPIGPLPEYGPRDFENVPSMPMPQAPPSSEPEIPLPQIRLPDLENPDYRDVMPVPAPYERPFDDGAPPYFDEGRQGFEHGPLTAVNPLVKLGIAGAQKFMENSGIKGLQAIAKNAGPVIGVGMNAIKYSHGDIDGSFDWSRFIIANVKDAGLMAMKAPLTAFYEGLFATTGIAGGAAAGSVVPGAGTAAGAAAGAAGSVPAAVIAATVTTSAIDALWGDAIVNGLDDLYLRHVRPVLFP